MAVYRDGNCSDFIKKIFICVPKMNESFNGSGKTWGEVNDDRILGELTLCDI